MECYSASKSKEILPHGTVWMNLEDVASSQISQTQEDKHYMTPCTFGTESHQAPRDGRWDRGGFGWREEQKRQAFFFNSFFLRFYLFIHERHTEKRERQRHRQREKQAPCREPDVGLDPGSPGSRPGMKVALNR